MTSKIEFAPILAAMACAVLSFSAEGAGETYYVKDGASDWTKPENYWNNAVPGADDIVVISNRSTVTVSSTDAASWALVSNLRSIRPLHTQSRIVFNVAEGVELTNNAAVYNPEGSINGFWGEMVKTGDGTLVLGSSNRHPSGSASYDYKVGTITVSEGTLKFPQNIPKCELQYGNLHVETGATVELSVFDTTVGASTMMFCVNGTLTGGGLIKNDNLGTRQLRVYKASEFSGTLTGHTQLFISGQVDFTGTGSTVFDTPTAWSLADETPGVIGVKKFGMKSDAASSIGVSGVFAIDYRGGGFRYLGVGSETTDKELKISPTTDNPASMDGGENGGLEFTGDWYMNGNPNQMHVLELKGSNPAACVLANDILDWANGGVNYAFQIVKYGTGTWRFADLASRGWSGALHVREGTVEFESLAEAGDVCSLGKATTLAEPYMGVYDEAKKVDYAVSLGGENEAGKVSSGTLAYVGSGRASSVSRPIALDGLGGTIKGSSEGELAVSGVSAVGSGARTLTLDAAEGTVNYLENVDEGDASLSLVKTGAGKWVLQGKAAVSGGLTVSNGTLEVRSVSDKYEYFRFTVKRVTGGGDRLNAVELALFDENGVQQFFNPVRTEPVPRSSNTWVWCEGDYRSLAPGEVSFGRPGWYKNTWYIPSDFRDFAVLFNGWASTNQPSVEIYYGGDGASAVPRSFVVSSPGTWLSFVMRLPENANRIVSYDIMTSSDYGRQWRPGTFVLEGSRDGIFWRKLHEVVDGNGVIGGGDGSDGQYEWMSDGTAGTWAKSTPVQKESAGWLIDTSVPSDETQFENLGQVSVAAGAKLVGDVSHVISSLYVDASAGAGEIVNFSFAASGTLEIGNYVKSSDPFELASVFSDVDGLENLAAWTVSGEGTERRRLKVRDGKVLLVPYGMTVTVR